VICNVLCVGTELLLGQIDDTNSTYIGQQLVDAGITSYEHRRVGDNPERIEKALRDLLEVSDAIIVTGGLGPTHDDITREVTATVMGAELEHDSAVLENMKAIFARRNREMPQTNLRQAMVPKGATVIHNHLGTAPGLMCPVGDKTIYLVPGVPHEMYPMVTDTIIPDILSRGKATAIVTRTIKTWGISESSLAEQLDAFVQAGETSDVKVGFLARGMNGIYVKLSASADTKEQARAIIAPVEHEVLAVLGEAAYGFDDDTMESIVIDLLKKQGKTIAIAESLTGGMLSSRLVDVPGSSDVHMGGVVSYTKAVKHDVLGVQVRDVYSNECAEQMAQGVAKHLGSDIGLSTTGVAGPDEDNGHPPGEVFIGISTATDTIAQRFLLGGDRKRVREYTTITAFDFLRRYLSSFNLD
jgi:nicotinamide-nucleotide amidase